MTTADALSQIILDRKPLKKVSALTEVIVKEKGTADELAGCQFALYPLWAAEEAEYLITTAMLVHVSQHPEDAWLPFTEYMQRSDLDGWIARHQALRTSILNRKVATA